MWVFFLILFFLFFLSFLKQPSQDKKRREKRKQTNKQTNLQQRDFFAISYFSRTIQRAATHQAPGQTFWESTTSESRTVVEALLWAKKAQDEFEFGKFKVKKFRGRAKRSLGTRAAARQTHNKRAWWRCMLLARSRHAGTTTCFRVDTHANLKRAHIHKHTNTHRKISNESRERLANKTTCWAAKSTWRALHTLAVEQTHQFGELRRRFWCVRRRRVVKKRHSFFLREVVRGLCWFQKIICLAQISSNHININIL